MLAEITTWPTTLQLTISDNTTPVTCEEPLRNLPGKRLVCRGTWQGRSVLIKLFLHPQRAQRHWQREKDGIALLTNNHLATPALLFTGALDDNTPVLIFNYLHDAHTALEEYGHCANDNERLLLLKQLVMVIATQHQCGVWQQDLHLGNFLISDNVIYTIDGDGIKSANRSALPLQQRRDNLALFLVQLPPRDEHLFAEIINHYAANSTDEKKHRWSSVINKELPHARNERRHNYVDKCYRSCSEFIRHNSFGQISIYRRDIHPELLHQLLDNPDALMAGGTILKDGNSATVVRVQIDSHYWVIKRYNIKNVLHAMKRCWRPTRAWISWGNAQRLAISAIDTPQAIAMIEKRFGPLRLSGYYVCAYIDAPSATDYFLAQPSANQDDENNVKLHFATLFGVMHQLGIYHGDCKGTNFLVQSGRPCIIDLDAMREFHCRQRFLRAFKADRKRFLRNWITHPDLHHWFDEHLPR